MQAKEILEFNTSWDPATVYDEPIFSNKVGETYAGYNYKTMRGLHFAGSQFLMTLAAINKLSKVDADYEFIADMGNVIKTGLRELLTETASWTNARSGRMFGEQNNSFKNIHITMARYDNPLSYHDRMVLQDVRKDLKYNATKLLQFLCFVRDSEVENDGALEDLPKLARFIEDLITYLELLQETKIKIPKKINMEKRKLSDLSLVELVALRQTLKDDIARHRALQEHGDRRVILDYEEAESKVYRRICDMQQSIDYNN